MKLKFAYLLLMVFLLCGASDSETWKIYNNSLMNYSINYPSDWQIKQLPGITAFVSPQETDKDSFMENVNILAEDLSLTPMSLDEYMKTTLKNGPKLINKFQLLEKGQAVLAGSPAFYIVYSGAGPNGAPLKFKGCSTVIGKTKAFTVTFSAEPTKYDLYLPQGEKICRSFTVQSR